MAKEKEQPDGSETQKPSLFQNLAAMVASIIAVKIITYLVTTLWRLATKEEPPQVDEDVPMGKKAAWLALTGAATGTVRQTVRDLIKPPSGGPA